jgi:glutamate-1-semialdehyde 2,1-aminomutase
MRDHALNRARSTELFARGRRVLPDGVSSPMRAFAQVGGRPICAASAKGARMTDADGNVYTDFLSAFGALFLGHAHDAVVAAIAEQAAKGTVYGLSTEMEYALAEKIVDSTSSIDKLRFVCSGTEAVMTAARIARSHTGRALLLKFRGSYHGHSDVMLASPNNIGQGKGSKGGTHGISDPLNREILLCEYNDSEELARIFAERGNEIAAVLVEPYATNMGFVKPNEGFHKQIRELCDRHGALFIFDEVVTGFRFRFGGVSAQMDVEPDLVTFGKIIGGGAPIGAYGGKAHLMDVVAIGGKVFQSGTFAANPLTMAAGNAVLDVLALPGFYEQMEQRGAWMEAAVLAQFGKRSIPYRFTRHGALCGVAFRTSDTTLRSYADVKTQQYEVFSGVHSQMLERGYLIAPSLEEPYFINAAHTREDIEGFAAALAESIEHCLASAAVAA